MDNMKEEWHLDKKVTLTLILAILINCASTIWWGAKLDSSVSNHEIRITNTEADIKVVRDRESMLVERLARIESNLEFQSQVLREIKGSLKR